MLDRLDEAVVVLLGYSAEMDPLIPLPDKPAPALEVAAPYLDDGKLSRANRSSGILEEWEELLLGLPEDGGSIRASLAIE